MSQILSNQVTVGSGINMFINGYLWGNVRSIRVRTVTANKRCYGLDNANPFDLMPTQNVANFTIETYLLIGEGGVGLEGTEVVAPPLLIQSGMMASVVLVSTVDQAIIFRTDTALVTTNDVDIPARGIISRVINFEALVWTSDSIITESTPV